MQFLEEVPLAPYTTFQIGGPARWFAEAASEDDIAAGIAFAAERKLPLFILAGAATCWFPTPAFRPRPAHRSARHRLHRGERPFDHLCCSRRRLGRAGRLCRRRRPCGGECLSGIPGTVGGTPVQNVGAYGQEVSQTIVTVRAFDRKTGQFVDLPASDCGFSYRRSIFNSSQRDRYVVSRVHYALHKDAPASFVYADVARYFAARNVTAPTLVEVREAVRSIRAQKGMLLMPGDADCRSAGSFFKNPVVPASVVDSLAQDLGVDKQSIPAYPAQQGEVKLSAAWLIERAGFAKGYALGNAGISSRHTLALINRGGASASEVTALRDQVIAAVASRFAVRLEPEPVWLA